MLVAIRESTLNRYCRSVNWVFILKKCLCLDIFLYLCANINLQTKLIKHTNI